MPDSRGQTTLDFAIGVSVFLIAVAAVIAFVPGMVQPFSENSQEELSVADRVATQLAQGMLADSTASILDTDCTVEFFSNDATGGATCAFSENDLSAGGTVPGRLGIDAGHEIQVRLQSDVDGDGTNSVLCWDEAKREVLESGAAACDVTFELQTSDPPQSGTVSTAVRVVSLRRYDTTLRVRTW